MAEFWDLYDRDGKRTGETFERGYGNYNRIPEGRYHLVVDILVIHEDGTYLLTKRDERKDVYPGYWEASAGGSAVSGEMPLEAAKRELFEETGLTADSFELVSVVFRDKSRSFFYSYLAKVSGEKDSIVLQEGETTDYKWVDKKGFLEYVDAPDTMKNHNARYERYINTLRDSNYTDTLNDGDYIIREIKKEDNGAVESVIRSCLIEFGGNHEGTAWADPNLGRFSEIYNTPGNKYWVAIDKNTSGIVGGTGIGALEGITDTCELQKMYCLPEARGVGLAQKLMEIALFYAKGYYKKCYLETLENMVGAQKFYEKNGFVKIDKPLLDTGHFNCDVRYIRDL
ncbi:MAG: GNAT family N-acetyltransferase [Lachnospiraceae bacterium]|nr:GNAT family N-acetyltransferase [Lachnospiraceae bacterium]